LQNTKAIKKNDGKKCLGYTIQKGKIKVSRSTFGIKKLDDCIILENVNFFNSRDGVHPNPFQGTLKPFIISGRGFVNSLLLSKFQRTNHTQLNKKQPTQTP
jgi:hypothetical protein